jgi:hypothetical protein
LRPEPGERDGMDSRAVSPSARQPPPGTRGSPRVRLMHGPLHE